MEAEHRDPAGKAIKIVITITITSPKTVVVPWTRALGGVVRIIKKRLLSMYVVGLRRKI